VCIAIVFCMGLGKLWRNNRLMERQELLDEEKRSRITEIRKTGVSLKKGAEIPFGVRAIQGGVEVDGIWISRPASPTLETKPKMVASSATTLIGLDMADPHKKGKMVDTDSMDSRQRNSQSDNSMFQRLTDVESLESNRSATPRHSLAPRPRHPRSVNALNEATLDRLNGHGHSRPTYDTYVPSRNPRRPSQRSTASSSGESVDSQPRSGVSARSGSGRSYASSGSSRMHHPSRVQYESRIDGYDTPASRTPISPLVLTENHSPLLSGHELPIPEPTFGPGDIHLNKTARKVNQGFEVLPAGTFGVSPELRATNSVMVDGAEERPTNRPRPPFQQNRSQNF
jgi:hypothetical protein